MKGSAKVTILPDCWLAVCEAFSQRYPNPYASHVLSEDTVYQEVKDDKFMSKRIQMTVAILRDLFENLVKKSQELTGADTRGVGFYVKRLISLTRNLEHKKLVVASETTKYVPD
ncbi:unnamed protein product [Heterotrigona itama]|uniref:PRELI/MSF1 domain-containing protein n=1 Tax=Heterotrigona itama TaxID=395501 RepID=A0A6V7HN72_9HYME|nr:unnamed protein product [Heterotrigona itama]